MAESLSDTGYGKAREGTPLIKASKPMRYVSLHHHSTFSYQDGYGLPSAHVRRAAELNMSALALTEHGNVSSHVKLEQAAKEYGIKPIFGCELYCGSVDPEKRTGRKNHLTVLAATPEGYRGLTGIVSRSWEEFYYEPTTSGENLARHKSGLFILSGCTGSRLATSLVGGKNIDPRDASYARARAEARKFKKAFGDRYFLEVQAFPTLEVSCKINEAYERIGLELGIPLVASRDCHYTLPTESEMQQILHNVRGGGKQTLEEQAQSWGYDVSLAPPTTDKEIIAQLRATGLSLRAAREAVENTALIAQDCNVTLPKGEMISYPSTEPAGKLIRKWLNDGWVIRGCNNLSTSEQRKYKERVKYELSIMEGKNFLDYFLVVSDMVRWAKDNRIMMGPARGSAAASLVCWLLRITEINPMLYPSLIFERFIDVTRKDLPDIDLDFDDERRGEVLEYLCDKYGVGHVANIGTFTQYKAKNSLDDVARAHRIPSWKVDGIKGLMIERSSGDLRANSTIEDTVEMFPKVAAVFEEHPELTKAMRLEGNYRGMGVHAAGIVVSSVPIQAVTAVYQRKMTDGSVRSVIAFDKYDAEYLNLLKIDALGLSTMGQIAICAGLIGMSPDDLYDIPTDDPTVIQGFKENDVVGIFQFDGRAMRSVNAEVRPDTFQQVADINALARPGPLHGGGTAEYIEAKQGRKPIRSLHPLLDAITKDTFGQIVYQEQILRIVTEIGGFDWTHAAYIRKIISKKIGEQEFNRQWDKFREGALERGLTEPQAQEIWSNCITAGAYAFNAAHSYSYGMIAWWCMWFKRHYPGEFYVSALRKHGHKKDKNKIKKELELLKDADFKGFRVLPPAPSCMVPTWVKSGDMEIRAGLEQIKGIGDKMAPKIIEHFSEAPPADWSELKKIRGIGDAKVQLIEEFCRSEDPFEIHKMDRIVGAVRDELRRGIRVGKSLLPRTTHRAKDVPYSKGQDTLVVWAGVPQSRNLRDIFELHFSRTGTPLDPKEVTKPELNEYVNMLAADETENLVLVFNRFDYPKFREAIWSLKLNAEDVVLVRGVKKGNQARRAIYVRDLWVIADDDDDEYPMEEF